ncbi:glycosyltransferase family protein [Humidesulfovibrio sp.]
MLSLSPEQSGLFDLPAELRRHGFEPDLLLQRERLGPRLLLSGLEELPCVRAFWAIDPHLNAFWHAPYAQLFDLVFSTQRRWMPQLAACGPVRLRHLPWHAPDQPFAPFDARPHLAGFVGRLGPTRQARTWLAELMHGLLGGGFALRDNLDFQAMLDFYSDAKVVPNESITGEVNFRLFEAAGCGCVVLAQNLGPEQAELFEPGREMLVCTDALELAENLSLLVKRPRLAEAMGRAAWERAQGEHLPPARARVILHEADLAPRRDVGAAASRLWLALAQAGLCEAERLPGQTENVLTELAELSKYSALSEHSLLGAVRDVAPLLLLNARLRLAHSLARAGELAALLRQVEAQVETLPPLDAGHGLSLALTCCALLLGLGGPQGFPADLPRALGFASRAGVDLDGLDCASPAALPGPMPGRPEDTAFLLLLAWARRLDEAHAAARGGFGFDAAKHLPASASECLHSALALRPGDTTALRASVDALGREPGVEALRLGLLSDLGLRQRDDWRIGLELGLVNLQAFRPGPGLDEIRMAAQLAEAQGQAEHFLEALAQADANGHLRRALAR